MATLEAFVRGTAALVAALVVHCTTVHAQAKKPGTYFVKESVVTVRLAPSSAATITNHLYLRQKVEVHELNAGWARISQYYDGEAEGKSGQVARWVVAAGLTSAQPDEPKQLRPLNDSRISKDAIPTLGQGGLTVRDIEILQKGALKFLKSGQCSRVEYADKSVNKPNTYYVNCGGPNLFFTPNDL